MQENTHMYKDRLLATLSDHWKNILKDEINATYFEELLSKLSATNDGSIVFPPLGEIFNAYNSNPISKIKVVILGQDPYHGLGQANGHSFSVKKGVRHPPSLSNIFKELHSDLQIPIPDKFNGDLTSWANQGVFLLNAVLTVEKSSPNAHKNYGWEKFTDATIQSISKNTNNVVFVFWGKYAQKKQALVDSNKHLIIASPHPSPFSARKGFFGSKPFSQINSFLKNTNQAPINWAIK